MIKLLQEREITLVGYPEEYDKSWNADLARNVAQAGCGRGWGKPRSEAMATQIVMDHSGDTRHHFDATDREAVAEAEERFRQLTGAGFTAAVRTAPGDAAVTRSFDPTAEETLFFPRLVGG